MAKAQVNWCDDSARCRGATAREHAIARAETIRPSCGKLCRAVGDIADVFLSNGPEAAAQWALANAADLPLDQRLRRRRYGLGACSWAGGPRGELPLERVTGLLSDFADAAIDAAVAAAIEERVPALNRAASP